MSEKVPIPADKLPLIAKRGLVEDYYNVVMVLTDRLSEAIARRLKVDPKTGESLNPRDEQEGACIDDETAPLVRAKFDATSLLDMFDGLIEEHGDDFWEVHKADLGDFLERLIHRKHACEMELLGLDMEFEYQMHRGGADA